MVSQNSSTLRERQEKAESLLDTFSNYTEYRHGANNPYRSWLNIEPVLSPELVIRFLRFWYPVSRHQPQILLRCAAAYPDWADRKLMMQNYLEEDGMIKPGDDPHYDLLEELINKIGGKLTRDEEAEELISRFHNTLNNMTPAYASGFIAGIEHPALDISAYFNKVIALCGFSSLLRTDPYLTIHVNVEPDHIIWSHGNALRYMEGGEKAEVLRAFQHVMFFWHEFWRAAFTRLGYHS